MKKNLFKKSMSVFLTALMLLSCWVFVPEVHEHLEAEAAALEAASSLYNKSLLNGINTNIDTTMTTVLGKFKDPSMEGDENASYHVSQYGSQHYKNIYYSPTVTTSMPAAKMTGISNIDSVMVYYPETVMIYDGSTKPQMGVVACVDGGNYAVRALSVYISANANGIVITDHWKGSTTANLAHIINMHNGSYQMSNDGNEHSSYKHNTKDHGEWYFYASDLRFDGTLASDEFVRTITPTWGFYGAYYRYYWLGNQTGSLTKITDVADTNIYVMNVKAYRDLLTTINTDKTNITNNAGQYTPESVKAYVTAAKAILDLNPKNVSQSGSAVKTWGSNMSTALTNYNTAKNGLKNREYEVTYDNMFSLADWKYSASSEKANVTTDLTNGKVTVQNTNASGEYVTPHSGNSTNANTRNTNNYAMPVIGGQEYVFKYTTDHADTQMFAFFYDANGGHTGTYGAYNLTVKNGTGQATFKAPDNATQMEIRFDNNTGATTANFWDIMIYPAAVKTEKNVDSWTNRPIRTVYAYNASVGTLPTPVRPGYIFDGWKEDTDGDGIGDAAISGNVTKSRVLYSSWKPGTMDVGYDNLFSLAAWANTKSNGKGNAANTSNIAVDLNAGTIAVTGKSDAYTTYGGGSDQYHVAVTAGETYIFDYDATSTNGTYQAFVFFYNDAGSGVTGAIYNGSAQSNAHIGLYNGQPITFTVPSGCTKVGFRVGICGDTEGTATYSNIGVYKKSAYDAYAKDYAKVREAFLIGDTKNLMTPTREGYNFEGWTLADGTKVTTTAGFDANTVVYANWSRTFTVTYYDSDRTNDIDSATVKEGATVGSLTSKKPSKKADANYSYTFKGWELADGTTFTKDTAVTSDLAVYPSYTVTAHGNFNFNELISGATCDKNAIVIKKCGNCGYSFGEVVYNPAEDPDAASNTGYLAFGHNFLAGEILAGSSSGNDELGTHKIKCAEYTACGATETVTHDWANMGETGADCTTAGTVKWQCPCGAERTTTGTTNGEHDYDYTTGTPNGDGKTHSVICGNNDDHREIIDCTDNDNNCVCDICGQELIHIYNKQTETYLASAATCVNDATYYYTCQCGKQGTETWTKTGTKLEHTYTNYVYNNDAKCGVDGTKTAECDTCNTGATDTITAEGTAREHEYTGAIKDNENGTHSYKCKYDDCDVYGGTVDCTYGEWDTTDSDYHVATCTACGHELKGEHDWTHWATTDEYKQADGQHSRSCYVCYKEVVKNCTYTRYSYAETCTTDGFTRNSCEYCGHNYKTNIIGKTGHDYTGTVKSYNNGQHSFLCKNGCNTYGYAGVENARTTCTYDYTNTAAGEHKATCKACAYSFTEACSGGQASCTTLKVCDKCNTEYGEKDPHSFTGTVVELEGDKHAYLCAYCSTEGLWGVGTDEGATEDCFGGSATCKDLAVCEKCSDTYGTLAAHTFDGEAVKLEGDEHAYRCSVCKDDTLYGVGSEVGVTEACAGGTATCKDLAVCDKCEDTHGDYTAHTFNGDAVKLEGDVHAYRCSVCKDDTLYGVGTTINDTVACSGGKATCTDLAVCDICNDTHGVLDPFEHKYSDECVNVEGENEHKYICEYNSEHYYLESCTNLTFTYVKPDCEAEGYTINTCGLCGHSWNDNIVPALEHQWGAWVSNNDGTHTRTCEREGCDYGTDGAAKVVTAHCNDSVSMSNTAAPTCTEKGYTTYWCGDCGYTWVDDYVDPTGHSFNDKIKVLDEDYNRTKLSCTSDETYWYRCDNCKVSAETEKDKYENEADLYYVNKTKSGHDFSDMIPTEKYLMSEATCTVASVYYFACKNCGEASKDSHYQYGSRLGHDWTETERYLKSAADCVNNEVYYKECSRCHYSSQNLGDETWTKENTLTGHDFDHDNDGVVGNEGDAGYTAGVEAKCLTDGMTEHYTCETCGKHFKADKETEIAADKLVIAGLKHNYKTIDAKPATCEEAGNVEHRQCQREGCGYRNVADWEIPATGHDFKAENGYYSDAINNYHAYKCTNCDAYGVNGVKYSVEFDGLDWVIEGGVECEFTGEYVNYEADGIHSHKLTCVCGNESSEACADASGDYTEAKCGVNGYYTYICEDCGFEWVEEVENSALAHNFDNVAWTQIPGKDKHTRACSNGCGEIQTKDCTTDNPADTCGERNICKECGSAFGTELPHDWQEVEDAAYLKSAATCEANAVYYKKCANGCGTNNENNPTWVKADSALGHKMFVFADADSLQYKVSGVWYYDNAYGYDLSKWAGKPADFDESMIYRPTCSEDGVAISFCTREGCTHYVTKASTKLDDAHIWGEEVSAGGNCATGVTFKKECTACGKTITRVEAIDHDYRVIVYVPATCEEATYEYVVCAVCGDDDEIYTGEALGHNWDTLVVDKQVTCGQTGRQHSICSRCNAAGNYEELPKLGHVWDEEGFTPDMLEYDDGIYVAASDATCEFEGHNGYYKCLKCSYDQHLDEEWRKDNIIAKKDHEDNDGNGKCDGCNAKLYGDEGNKSCDCICHKENWFSKIIYKILCFFWRLFGIGKSCDCGAVHY